MNKVSSNKVGLAFGGMLGIVHAVWALMILLGIAKPFMDWILGLHFLSFQYDVEPFIFSSALLLVLVTSLLGYLMGYVAGWLWNLAHRTSHGR
jgi:hypothetical protein